VVGIYFYRKVLALTYFISKCNEFGIPKNPPVKCAVCGFKAKNEGGLRHHVVIHGREK